MGSRLQIRGQIGNKGKTKKYRSIFERLFWTQAFVLLLVFISISITMTVFIFTYTTHQKYETVMKASQSIQRLTTVLHIENLNSVSDSVYFDMLTMWSGLINADITITKPNGEIFASTNTITRVPSDYVTTVKNGGIVKKMNNFGGYYSADVYTVGVPMLYNKSIVGCMFFNTAMPDLYKMVVDILCIFLFSGSSTIILAFIFIYFQSRRISRPIKAINKAVLEMASGKFDMRVAVKTEDEIGQLASSFNFMADSVQRLDEMRNSFISDVSHELRTPMTSISGFVSGILDHTIPPEEEEKYLNIVLDESKRLTKLVNDMLDVSKMENAQFKLDITEFDINELIRLCIIQLGQRIDDKNLELEVDFANDTQPVLADKDSIRRVMINLIDNAIKFSFEKTKITIKVWVENKKVHVSVGNFGIGIEKDNLRHVFDRFYKTDKSRSSDKKGAGLGLALVNNIISYHKEHIWVESISVDENSNTKYTTFTFTLEKA